MQALVDDIIADPIEGLLTRKPQTWFSMASDRTLNQERDSVQRSYARAEATKKRAFSSFLAARQDMVLRTAMKMLRQREDAMDVLQEVALILYKRWDALDQEKNIEGWLYRVTVNECYRWLKAKKKVFVEREESTVEAVKDDAPGQDAHVRTRQFQVFLGTALGLLSEQERLAFVLRDIEQRPGKEIAQMMGCQGTTVRGYYFSARKKLAAHIKARAPEWLSLLGGAV